MNKRDFIKSAFIGLGGLFGLKTYGSSSEITQCRETSSFYEGPFHTMNKLVRRDLTEGIPGQAMDLHLTFIDSNSCEPLTGISVDVWLADPDGNYSDVKNAIGGGNNLDTEGKTFLRGTQITDGEGKVLFNVLFPGWYKGTAPHIHYAAYMGAKKAFISQLFMEDKFASQIHTTIEPYNLRGKSPLKTSWFTHSKDNIVVPQIEKDKLILKRKIGINSSELTQPKYYREHYRQN